MTGSQQEKDISVCSRLREERDAANLAQQDIAETLGKSLRTVARWEKTIPIPSDQLAALTELGIDAVYVLTGYRTERNLTREDHHGGGFYAKSRTTSTAEPLNLWERSVLDCMRQLKPEHQRMLEGIAQSILKTQQEQEVIDDFVTGKKSKGQDEEWWPDPTVKND